MTNPTVVSARLALQSRPISRRILIRHLSLLPFPATDRTGGLKASGYRGDYYRGGYRRD